MDEWIYFLKNGEVQEAFSARGLPEAKKKLDEINLSDEEKAAYKRYLKKLRDIASEQHTKMEDAKFFLEEFDKGKKLKEQEAVIGFNKIGVTADKIAQALNISKEKVIQIIEETKQEK